MKIEKVEANSVDFSTRYNGDRGKLIVSLGQMEVGDIVRVEYEDELSRRNVAQRVYAAQRRVGSPIAGRKYAVRSDGDSACYIKRVS